VLTVFEDDQPSAFDFVVSSLAVILWAFASGCITTGAPNISAISRIEWESNVSRRRPVTRTVLVTL
jgi:hypothetical protein